MFKVTVNTEIEVPAAEAYAFVADLSNNPSWQFGIESTDWTSEPPVQVGSTYDQTTEYKKIVTGYEVTAVDPGRSITIESRSGATIPTTVTRTVQELNESRCRIRVDLVGQLSGWRGLTRPLVVRMIRRSVDSDYRRLKRQLEGKATESDPS